MRFGRTLPPAATPITIAAILSGVRGIFRGSIETERFRAELIEHFGMKNCFLVSSGKTALTLTLLALRELYPERDEVVIPAYTCYSVPASILKAGLRIRLCDLANDSLDFDFERLTPILHPITVAACVSPDGGRGSTPTSVPSVGQTLANDRTPCRVLAVIPTHLLGLPADVARLRSLIRDPKISIIEDAAQAMGESSDNRKLGTIGDVGIFSLARGKAFTTVEGGIILTDRPDVAAVLNRKIGMLPEYGYLAQIALFMKALVLLVMLKPSFFWIPKSLPFLNLGVTVFEPNFESVRMSAFQAGLSVNWQARLDMMRQVRMKLAEQWASFLKGMRVEPISHSHLQLPGLLRFPVRIPDQEQRRLLLYTSESKGVGIMPVYPKAINELQELGYATKAGEFANAERYARELVTLPTHGYVESIDVAAIRRILAHTLKGGRCAAK